MAQWVLLTYFKQKCSIEFMFWPKKTGDLGGLERMPTPEAALRELLKGRSDYHQPDVPVALAPYRLERVSLPTSLRGLPQAEELLPEDARRYLQGEELMLRAGTIEDAPLGSRVS